MRALEIAGATLLGAVLVFAAASYAILRGWHVEKLGPEELSTLLRPHDVILVPDGAGPFPAVILRRRPPAFRGGSRPHRAGRLVPRRLVGDGPDGDGSPDGPADQPRAPPAGLEGLEGVAGVVLFYPYCGFPSRSESGWSHRAPVFFVLAGADSVVSNEQCLAVARRLEADGQSVRVHVYEGLDHAFDQADRSPDSPLPYDPVAARDARQRVARFLRTLSR